jgi:hypothetical protein
MSGYEIFGTIGTAVAVVEAINWTLSYIQDFKHATKEKKALHTQLKGLRDFFKGLREAIERQPSAQLRDSALKTLDAIEESLDEVDKKGSTAKKFNWKFVKADIEKVWIGLERLKTSLLLGMIGHVS